MTDQNPSPTERMPVPTPPAAPAAADEAGEPRSAPAVASDADSSVTRSPTEAPRPAAQPVPPVAAPTRRSDPDHGRTASILFGLVFLGLGLWFFVEHTLGYDLPTIQWSQIWPVFLIVIGLWVVLGSRRRGSR